MKYWLVVVGLGVLCVPTAIELSTYRVRPIGLGFPYDETPSYDASLSPDENRARQLQWLEAEEDQVFLTDPRGRGCDEIYAPQIELEKHQCRKRGLTAAGIGLLLLSTGAMGIVWTRLSAS